MGVIDSMMLKMKGSVCYETVVLRRWRGLINHEHMKWNVGQVVTKR